MTTMAPLPLYRSLLRNAKHFHDYNFRSYAIRRVKTDFRKNRNLQGEEAEKALKFGTDQLAALKRQTTVSQLYPSARSVMEV